MATTSAPSASYSVTLRIQYPNRVGMLRRVTSAISEAGGDISIVDIVESSRERMTRDVTVNARDLSHGRAIVEKVRAVEGVTVLSVSDRTFQIHLGGKIEIVSKAPLKTRDDLSMAYTPGVARICQAIAEEPRKLYSLTIKRNSVAVVTDGSAVLGLGNIGPEAALPVMEGKALLFKQFGGVDAFPICLKTQDPDEIVETVERISPVFGGINLEDISAPRCFGIEQRLAERLDIPVFHDDQHGTAVVVLAALLNACRVVARPLHTLKVVISGAGAGGVAVTKILKQVHVADIIVCDTKGAIYKGREQWVPRRSSRSRQAQPRGRPSRNRSQQKVGQQQPNPAKQWLSEHTNKAGARGSLRDVLAGADVFIGLSAAGLLRGSDLKRMTKDAIVFAMANPVPEVMPEEAAPYVRVMATGRSDYPNQINNVLCFPGLFRGLLDTNARCFTEGMKIVAAKAIAGVIRPAELREDYIIPSVFDKKVSEAVARAVAREARSAGVARRMPKDC